MKKTFVLLLVTFLSTSNFFLVSYISAQVKIEEKVEIDPQNLIVGNNPINFPDSTFENSGNDLKQESLNYGPASTIYLNKPGKVKVTVIFSEAAGTAKIDLIMRAPEQQTLKEYANQNIGFSWTSPDYPTGTSIDLGIWWYYNSWGTIYQGFEAGAIMTQTGPNEYEIGFEAAGDDWDYNELVIEVVVVGDECSPLCNGEPPETNILTTRLFNIYFDPCEDRDKDPTTLELGGFTPVKGKDKWRNPSYFHPCFDDVEQVWRFSMNAIQLYVTVDFCQNYLSRYQVISNISEVDSNEVCDAVKDFKNHEFYPLKVRNGGYMIMELLEMHEEIHERVYLEYMTENKEAFDRILSEFKPTCEEYPNQILAYAGALEKLDPLINSYFTNNYEKWKDDMGWTDPIDKVKRKQDEDRTQSHPEVQAIWNNYIKSLAVLYPSKYKKCK